MPRLLLLVPALLAVLAAPARVGIVERDRHASPLAGAPNICCVDRFRTQVSGVPRWCA